MGPHTSAAEDRPPATRHSRCRSTIVERPHGGAVLETAGVATLATLSQIRPRRRGAAESRRDARSCASFGRRRGVILRATSGAGVCALAGSENTEDPVMKRITPQAALHLTCALALSVLAFSSAGCGAEAYDDYEEV